MPETIQPIKHVYTGSAQVCSTCLRPQASHRIECSDCKNTYYPETPEQLENCPICAQIADTISDYTKAKVSESQKEIAEREAQRIAKKISQDTAEIFRNSHIAKLRESKTLDGAQTVAIRQQQKEFLIKHLASDPDYEQKIANMIFSFQQTIDQIRVKMVETNAYAVERRQEEIAKLTEEQREELKKRAARGEVITTANLNGKKPAKERVSASAKDVTPDTPSDKIVEKLVKNGMPREMAEEFVRSKRG